MKGTAKLIVQTAAVVAIAVVAVALVAKEPPDRASVHLAAPTDPVTVSSPPSTGSGEAITLLSWDDGSFENGLGPTGGHYDGQFAMRFGGSAATTALLPFQIRGAHFRLRSGAPGITFVNINFWYPLTAGGFPAGGVPVAQAPALPLTGVTQTVSISGPTISSPNGSVMVGVGGLGTTSWFIDRDTDGPDYNREFAGESANNTLVLTLGPTTLGAFGFSGNYYIRLVVDGNIPVELERFTIE